MGVENEAKYEKDGNQIKIMNTNGSGNMILTMTDDKLYKGKWAKLCINNKLLYKISIILKQ